MYPKYKYHAKKEPVLVHNEEQESKLGDKWKESPADHGIITQPSEEQQFEMDTAKEKGGRPKKTVESVDEEVEPEIS